MAFQSGKIFGQPVSSQGMASVEVTGMDKLASKMSNLAGNAMSMLSEGLQAEANKILETCKAQYVPIETGALHDSGFVNGPEFRGDTVNVTIGFGGPTAPYALAVHEIPPPPATSEGGRSARHGAAIGKPAGQTWKYLEKAVQEAIPGLSDRISEGIA